MTHHWLTEEELQKEERVAARGHVFAVVCANYEPAEVDTLWNDQAAAEARADELGEMWRAEQMTVHEPGDKIDD